MIFCQIGVLSVEGNEGRFRGELSLVVDKEEKHQRTLTLGLSIV